MSTPHTPDLLKLTPFGPTPGPKHAHSKLKYTGNLFLPHRLPKDAHVKLKLTPLRPYPRLKDAHGNLKLNPVLPCPLPRDAHEQFELNPFVTLPAKHTNLFSCQFGQPMDMWYVLNAPDSMELDAPTLSKRRSSVRPPEGFQQKEGEAKDGIGDEAVRIFLLCCVWKLCLSEDGIRGEG